MNHSTSEAAWGTLINPNQIRAYGVSVHDNPYEQDPERAIGIELYDDVHLPFLTNGSTVNFESKYLTDEEMERCPHVVLTSDAGWKPQEVSMHPIGNVE